MSIEEQPQVPDEAQKTALEESQEQVCQEQPRRGQYVVNADNTELPERRGQYVVNADETELPERRGQYVANADNIARPEGIGTIDTEAGTV